MSKSLPRFPFRVGGAIQSRKEFVGREQILTKLYGAMVDRQSVSLHGERRTGKTSLLRRLTFDDPFSANRLPSMCVPIYFDFQKYSSAPAADVWRALSEAIAHEIRTRRPDHTEAALRFLAQASVACVPGAHPQVVGADVGHALGHLRPTELQLVLLLDEFEQTALNSELGQNLYDTLRSLTGEVGGLMYIVATRMGLGRLQQDVREASYQRISSPFFNIFTSLDLPCFGEDEAIELLYRYFGQVGHQYLGLAERLSTDLDFLFDQTGFHPFFIQALCYHFCQQLDQPEWPRGLARDAALQAFMRDTKDHFAYYWDVSDPSEQRVMSLLARGQSITDDDETTLIRLHSRCLVVDGRDGAPRLFAEGFHEWVSRVTRQPSAAIAVFRTETLRQQIALRSPYEVLDSYLVDHEGLLAKAQLEWRMAERALEEPPGYSNPPAFPSDLLGRPSGAMLLWIIRQHLRIADDLPGSLAVLPPLTEDQRRLFVRAWALWPDNPCLTAHLEAIIAWLSATPAVLGVAATLLTRIGGNKLAAACAQLWLEATPFPRDIIELLPDLLDAPYLRNYGREALLRALMAKRHDHNILRELCVVAFKHKANDEALTAAALHTLVGDQPYDPNIGAIYIAACAALSRHDLATRLYEQHWYRAKQVINFPYPQYLLPALQRSRAAHLRIHLLQHCDLSTSVPLNVRLEALTVGERPEVAGELWSRLMSQDKLLSVGRNARALYFLLQATEACIRADDRAVSTRSFVLNQWRALLAASNQRTVPSSIARLAAAAVVLIETDDSQKIAYYQDFLLQTPLHDNNFIQRAGRIYLLALIRQHRWSAAARFIKREDFIHIRAHCTTDEYECYQLLMTYMLDSGQTTHDILRLWQMWICKPLPDQLVCMVVNHVADTLAQRNSEDNAVLAYILPHILRRGRALGERLLREAPTMRTPEQLTTRLSETTILTIGPLLETILRNLGRR